MSLHSVTQKCPYSAIYKYVRSQQICHNMQGGSTQASEWQLETGSILQHKIIISGNYQLQSVGNQTELCACICLYMRQVSKLSLQVMRTMDQFGSFKIAYGDAIIHPSQDPAVSQKGTHLSYLLCHTCQPCMHTSSTSGHLPQHQVPLFRQVKPTLHVYSAGFVCELVV